MNGFRTISDRVLSVKLRGKPVNIYNIIQAYASSAARTEECIDVCYNDLNVALNQCKKFELPITCGDFSAKVGHEKVSGLTSGYGTDKRNYQGAKLIVWADSH